MKALHQDLAYSAAAIRHKDELVDDISSKIATLYTRSASASWRILCLELDLNLSQILAGKLLPLSLLEASNQWVGLLQATIDDENDNRALRGLKDLKLKDPDHPRNWVYKIFDYTAFSRKSTGWNAHALCIFLGANICPYCNRDHIAYFPVRRKSIISGYRPDLDHFMSRSGHPWFALSFFNLIPSCQTCNSRVKGDRNFDPSSHMSPIHESLDNCIEFTLRVTRGREPSLAANASASCQITDKALFSQVISIGPRAGAGASDSVRAIRTLDEMEVVSRYHSCPDQILFLLERIRNFPEVRIRSVVKLMGLDSSNPAAISAWKFIHLGASGNDVDVHRRSLGKLFNDFVRIFHR